jgi:TupA-like ATPgrasp
MKLGRSLRRQVAVTHSIVRQMRREFVRRLPLRSALTLEFLYFHHRFPRLDHPRTFCEKIAHRKLFDRNPLMPELSDKILAKEYVARELGPEWVIPNVWSGERLPPRAERCWQIPYVLKANHGSAWNYFVLSEADQDWDAIEARAAEWLNMTYGRHAVEWLYTQIKPRLLVEPFVGMRGVAPADYKFFVFGGRTIYIQVDLGRLQTHRQLFYDVHWKRQRFEYMCPWTEEEVEPPQSLGAMIEAANHLGAPFPFARVDLYELDGKPRFGEMTFYPNSGRYAFKPESAELELGDLWPEEPARGVEPQLRMVKDRARLG